MRTRPHLSQLTECIREGDRPIGLLLGAGCAKSIPHPDEGPLIPDTKGMTSKIDDRAQEADISGTWDSMLDAVKDHEDQTPNVEDILSRVRGLIQHVGDVQIGGIGKDSLTDLEDFICDQICEMVDENLPEEGTGYHDMATWLRSIDRSQPVEIFTSNYDLLIEEALESFDIPYFDGFVGARRPFFDPYSVSNDQIPLRWLRLWKIHGSINWAIKEGERSTQVWRSDSVEGGRQAVIHPSHRKYDESRKMPFLALIDRLEDFVRRPDSVLFTVGYSFGDDHLNDVIMQGLKAAPSSAVFAFMYKGLEENKSVQKLAKRQGNFTLLARDGGVIGTEVREWGESESEPEENSFRPGVDWIQDDNGKWQERLVLGDFREFGNFLKSVTAQTT